MGHNGEKRPERGDYLTHKQVQALAALLTQPTKEKAAQAAGIGVTTLKRYLDDPEFQEEYQKAVSDLVEDAATAARRRSRSPWVSRGSISARSRRTDLPTKRLCGSWGSIAKQPRNKSAP